MADSTNSKDPTSQPPGPDNPIPLSDPSLLPRTTVTPESMPNPNPNPNSVTPQLTFAPLTQPPPIHGYPTLAQSFRPAGPSVPLQAPPQYVPLNFQNTGVQVQVQVQPPGVSTVAPSVPGMMAHVPPGQLPMRPYMMQNGYPTMTGPVPPGILRYPAVYSSMMRPGFPQRLPGPLGFVMQRPPLLGMRGPITPPVVRPAVLPIAAQTEKPQPTVYVGKISSTVENDFMLSLLQLCGPVKSWNRPQDPTNGALKGFGICEFDSAEGVLRALRLLSKLSVDGQELMLNVNQATREFLERYVGDKKKAHEIKANEKEGTEKEEEKMTSATEKKDETDDSKDSQKSKEIKELGSFGLITDEEKEADRVASEKLKSMLEVRLKNKPLPPPPPPPLPPPATDTSGGQSNSEIPSRSKDKLDSDLDVTKRDGTEDRYDEETISEPDKAETATSPERSRRNERRSRDRERDSKRDKERELERLERDREQERAKRERDREYKNREEERRFRARLKEWELRERERDHARKLEREREKEREQERKREIIDQERDSEDAYSSKKRKYKTGNVDDRKRRLREKEDDLADRLLEDEEIAEAKIRAEEEREIQLKQTENTFKILSANSTANGTDIRTELPFHTNIEMQDAQVDDHASDADSGHGNHTGGNDIHQNGIGDESALGTSESRQQSNNAPTRKLGFGLVGSGKRTAVPSVFHEEEDEDAQKDKKMRPLVPIDYSTEELQGINDSTDAAPSKNLEAAAEFAKRISNDKNTKEDNAVRERSSRRTHERSSSHHHHHHHRDRDREEEKAKAQENKKLLDAKQLIDAIPKTKEDLFAYEINWVVYDKNDLHEKMKPWISKKITEFLGEEETTLVDYIVSSTREHVKAPDMLERLQTILDDEAEMFVLKMWRMLIFEIKRVETGLTSRSKA